MTVDTIEIEAVNKKFLEINKNNYFTNKKLSQTQS